MKNNNHRFRSRSSNNHHGITYYLGYLWTIISGVWIFDQIASFFRRNESGQEEDNEILASNSEDHTQDQADDSNKDECETSDSASDNQDNYEWTSDDVDDSSDNDSYNFEEHDDFDDFFGDDD